MDKSLLAVCSTLKKIIHQLRPHQNPIAFTLVTGKVAQGKSMLLRQSQLEHVAIESECFDIYYNQDGVFLELGETWLNQSNHLLQHTLRKLNQCHRHVKISGIILCIDINELFLTDAQQFIAQCKTHAALLERFGSSLGKRLDVALFFTKVDALIGFSDFFQYEHNSELQKPLGFSLPEMRDQRQFVDSYKTQFDQFIDTLNQQVIHKLHPARSTIKRTHIREFPLQLATLRTAIQLLIQTISLRFFHIHALYFTSAEQSGLSQDRLNKKIQHEYALTIQDSFPQSINYRAYFIEGALRAIQIQTKCHVPSVSHTHRKLIKTLSGIAACCVLWVIYRHFTAAELLDDVSKELLTYETLTGKSSQTAEALYHLAQASSSLEKIHADHVFQPSLQKLKLELRFNAAQHLQDRFLPNQLAIIEKALTDPRESHADRYQALKIYLMLGDAKRFSQEAVLNWFEQRWQKYAPKSNIAKKVALFKDALSNRHEPLPINQQLVSDVRNYLNALPANYLYYSLAKSLFPKDQQDIHFDGFVAAQHQLPVYFTADGFQKLIEQLPQYAQQLQLDNWVLARDDLKDLPGLLQQAYCYDYVTWWKNFIKHSTLQHVRDYQEASLLAKKLYEADTLSQVLAFIQKNTTPHLNADSHNLFNQEIASQFAELSLMSQSATRELNSTIHELEKFLLTLAVVHDDGKTAFVLTKARFNGDTLANPLSTLITYGKQLPEPLAGWANQLANESWINLFSEARTYINQQWREVYEDYSANIAERFPFDLNAEKEMTLHDFNRFFAKNGVLNQFIETYLKPFLDTSQPQWQLKASNQYVLPIAQDTINELIRANVITNMFFPDDNSTSSRIEFSLQKLSLDPVVASLNLMIGQEKIVDTQESDSFKHFHWPQSNVKLVLKAIDGKQFELAETGEWAFFKMLQKVNVLVDEQDSANLQILFEVNGNTGRYLLRTQNKVNPFIPGILNGFILNKTIV